MATYQANLTETKAQIATGKARAAVQAIAMASAENNQRTQNAGLKMGGPLMRQPMFNWTSTDNYLEPRNFRMEVKNMFQNYNINQAERVPIINKLDRLARPTTIKDPNTRRTRRIQQ